MCVEQLHTFERSHCVKKVVHFCDTSLEKPFVTVD